MGQRSLRSRKTVSKFGKPAKLHSNNRQQPYRATILRAILQGEMGSPRTISVPPAYLKFWKKLTFLTPLCQRKPRENPDFSKRNFDFVGFVKESTTNLRNGRNGGYWPCVGVHQGPQNIMRRFETSKSQLKIAKRNCPAKICTTIWQEKRNRLLTPR